MYRYLSSVRHGRGSSLISLFAAPKPSLPSLRALISRYSSGIPRNDEHARGFPSSNSGGRVRNPSENVDAHPGLQSFETPAHARGFPGANSGWRGRNPSENVNARPGFMWDRENLNTRIENVTETGRNSRPVDFVRGILDEAGKDLTGLSELSRYNDADFVHIKMLRNNTFVTVTDSKGNIKLSGSAGCLKEMKSGQKLSRYAAEATAEVVGRRARGLGLKSVVMKVKGFTYFKRKRQAILSWREGFTDSRGNRNPIVYIEDTTRRPHNGCRLPKKRRI